MSHILDVTGDDIANLNDTDLRTLVARLALAELSAQGLPVSGVTAGGDQDAADGGIDVKVDCGVVLPKPDFVPRAITGFQVKKPDMPVSAIEKEMRKDGKLRDAIKRLMNQKGAYIIVSAQGSVADKPLKVRRDAIRQALRDEANPEDLVTDFYDRDRMATWANLYPGVGAWVRGRAGRAVAGWGPLGKWVGTSISNTLPFLSNDAACLIDETCVPPEIVTVREGIARLRTSLDTPRTCVRLVGLSGLGKTRIVHALFEEGIGDHSLDASLALYTDYGVEPATSARDMAQQLVSEKRRAILIVDNCNASTHAVLSAICREPESKTTLLTVEYDVRDDEPEETDVFRLQPASASLVAEWLNAAYPNVSSVDALAIAEFSDGNFRIAAALSATIEKGKPLGSLKGQDLFDRMFVQRQSEDKNLRKNAEDLALLYSIDAGSTAEDSELARIGRVRDLPAHHLFETLAELRARGLLQSRGRYRAILPQAIANPLATDALKRIAPDALDQFIAILTPRMLPSLAHRLGFLHDSPEARGVLARWMAPGGRLCNLADLDFESMRLLTTLAPLAPNAVLTAAAAVLTQAAIYRITDVQCRGAWVRLIHALAFDETSFEVAAMLLSRFLLAEGETDRYHEARNAFAQLFHVQLSGTRSKPGARRAFVRRLAQDPDMATCVRTAIAAVLDTDTHSPYGWPTFGARSRDWGWIPESEADYVAWFRNAIALAVELEKDPIDGRSLLAKHFAALWRIESCRDSLENAARHFVSSMPWTDGWLAARRALQFLRFHKQPDDPRLVALVETIAPTTLLDRAKATVMSGGGAQDDLEDEDDSDDALTGWSPADKAALAIGRELSRNAAARNDFIPALIAATSWTRAFVCGRGLFEGSNDVESLFTEMLSAYQECAAHGRDTSLLAGFVRTWHGVDREAAGMALQTLADDPDLAALLPGLELNLPLGREGAVRLLVALDHGFIPAENLRSFATSVVADTPVDALDSLLRAIGEMPEGPGIALDILHARLWSEQQHGQRADPVLVETGRALFERFDFSAMDTMRDYHMERLITDCLAGIDGTHAARSACLQLRKRFDTLQAHPYQLTHTMPALFRTQPTVALDAFLLRRRKKYKARFWRAEREFGDFLHIIPPAILVDWANIEPSVRFGVLADAMTLFVGRRSVGNGELSETFIAVLGHAPDKNAFLGNIHNRLQPTSWSGSLAHLLEDRIDQLRALSPPPDGLKEWLQANDADLANWIANERSRDRDDEQAFE